VASKYHLKIAIAITATQTDDLESGVWDLELTNGSGGVKRLLEGKAIVDPQVTR
jgi:hypothetical protein